MYNLLYAPCLGEECCRCTMNHEFLQISLHYWHKLKDFSLPMLYCHHQSDHFWFSQDPECKLQLYIVKDVHKFINLCHS